LIKETIMGCASSQPEDTEPFRVGPPPIHKLSILSPWPTSNLFSPELRIASETGEILYTFEFKKNEHIKIYRGSRALYNDQSIPIGSASLRGKSSSLNVPIEVEMTRSSGVLYTSISHIPSTGTWQFNPNQQFQTDNLNYYHIEEGMKAFSEYWLHLTLQNAPLGKGKIASMKHSLSHKSRTNLGVIETYQPVDQDMLDLIVMAFMASDYKRTEYNESFD
jgi:hypothetical protein